MKKHHWLILFTIIVGGGLLYLRNINDFFISDDFDWLYLTATRSQHLWQYLMTNYYGQAGLGGSYRPMFNWLFAFDYSLWGLNPLGYHLNNLVFHLGNIILVFLLARRVLVNNNLALLTTGLFAVMPSHTEAVVWIAARGDVVVTFFFLLTWLLYLYKPEKYWPFILSLCSLVAALLTKEMAVVLPVVILLWEFYSQKTIFLTKKTWLKISAYFTLVVAFFVARYLAIGLAAGYYADNVFQFSLRRVALMLLNLSSNVFLFFQTRLVVRDWLWDHRLATVVIVIISGAIILYLAKKARREILWWLGIYLILTLPLWSLLFGINNDEGERYNYLPSVAVVMLLVILWREVYNWKKYLAVGLAGLLIIYFSYFTWQKNTAWQIAGQQSLQVLHQFSEQVNLSQKQEVWLVNLPDTYRGAQVWRNGFAEALNLFYPDNQIAITRLPVWWLDTSSLNTVTINIDDDGYFLRTDNYLFTGPARHQTTDYYTELWGYDYSNYTSSQVKLFIKNSPDRLLIFDGRRLQNMLY